MGISQSTIALIILAVVVVLYITEKIPIVLTTMSAMLLMVVFNIITVKEAFAGFSGNAIMLIIGMSVLGNAFFTTGLAGKIGDGIDRLVGTDEKKFLRILCLAAALLGIVLNGMVVVSVTLPIVDSMVAKSQGKITRKNIILPVAIAAHLGGTLSAVSATSMVTAGELLSSMDGGFSFSFFDPAKLTLPGLIAMLAFVFVFGYKMAVKCFDFEELEVAYVVENKGKEYSFRKGHAIILAAVLVVSIYLFAFTKINLGLISLCAATVLMLTHCIEPSDAIKNISWQTVLIVAASVGFAAGLEKSGAGKLIADKIIALFGAGENSGYAMCVVILLTSTLLSNFISNNSAVVIVLPVGLSIASALGVNPLPFALAAGVGSNISMATPICCAGITLTTCVGYRFKDYIKYGGIINLIMAVSAVIMLRFWF